MINNNDIVVFQKMIGEWLDIATCRSALEHCGKDRQKAGQWLIEKGIIEYVKVVTEPELTAIPVGYSSLFKGASALLNLDDILFNNRIGRRFPMWRDDKLRIRMILNCLKQIRLIAGLTKNRPIENISIEILETVIALFHYKVTSILQLPEQRLIQVDSLHIPTGKHIVLFISGGSKSGLCRAETAFSSARSYTATPPLSK